MSEPRKIWSTGSLGERYGSLGTRIPTIGMRAAGITQVTANTQVSATEYSEDTAQSRVNKRDRP